MMRQPVGCFIILLSDIRAERPFFSDFKMQPQTNFPRIEGCIETAGGYAIFVQKGKPDWSMLPRACYFDARLRSSMK